MEIQEYEKMHALEETNWWYLSRLNLIRKLIRTYAPNPSFLIDVGCGDGFVLHALAQENILRRVGVEQHALPQRIARERGLAIVSDMDSIKEKADVILAMDVVEHVTDDVEFLRSMWSKVKPGGIGILTVPAFQWLWSPHDEKVHHVRRYSKKEFSKKLVESGVEILHESYWNASFFLPALIKKKIFYSSEESDLQKINPIMNRAALTILTAENSFVTRFSMPIGTSVVAVVRIPTY